jgi:DnaJ-domain-containing protein 1
MTQDGGLPKPLSEMSDRELEAELQRRRAARAARQGSPAPITDVERRMLERFERSERGASGATGGPGGGMADAVARLDLAKHYAALELKPGATLAQVQRAFEELMARYDPDKHRASPDKHRAATQLVAELTRSYQILSERLVPSRR